MSFAKNFLMGQQIANNLIDTYYAAKERAALERINSEKPEDLGQAYTEKQAQELQAIANATDQNGNKYYELTANPDGSYGIKPRFQYQGADGAMVQPDAPVATIAPTTGVQQFLGERYEAGQLTPEKIRGLKMRATADVVAERNPIAAQRMLLDADRADRELEEYNWRKGLRPFEQKKLELDLWKAEDEQNKLKQEDEFLGSLKKFVSEYSGDPGQVEQAMAYVNTRSKSITMGAPDPKTGVVELSVVQPDGSAMFSKLTRSEAAQLYAAARLMDTDPVRAMAVIDGVNSRLADAIARENNLFAALAKVRNDAANIASNDNYRRGMLALQQRQIDAYAAKAANAAKSGSEGEPRVSYKAQDGILFRNGLPAALIDPEFPGGIKPFGPPPVNIKQQAELAEQGVQMIVVQDADGNVRWGFTNANDPSGQVFSAPEEALKAGSKPTKRTGLPPPVKPSPSAPDSGPFPPLRPTSQGLGKPSGGAPWAPLSKDEANTAVRLFGVR